MTSPFATQIYSQTLKSELIPAIKIQCHIAYQIEVFVMPLADMTILLLHNDVRSFVRVNNLTPGVMEEGNFYSSQVHHNDNCIYLILFILSKFHLHPRCLCEKFGHKHPHIISSNIPVSVLLIYIFISGIVTSNSVTEQKRA